MPGTAVDGLRGLAQALDAGKMLPLVAEAAGVEAGEDSSCSIRILAHKPGQRCTIGYALESPRADPIFVVGKLYHRPRLAARVFAWTHALSAENGTLARVPEPLLLEPELGLVLHASARGDDLRHALRAGTAQRPLELAARWLARLHASPPLPDLRPKPLAHELAKLDGWVARLDGELPARAAARLELSRRSLHRVAAALPPRPATVIHRDLYYAHVLWDGRGVWILDLDQLALGDPVLDVGHFLAHLETLALRSSGRPDAYAEDGAAFLEAYSADALSMMPALNLYRASTFVKLAETEAARRKDGWEGHAADLVELACREADAAVRTGVRLTPVRRPVMKRAAASEGRPT
jgi:hypothetical protein